MRGPGVRWLGLTSTLGRLFSGGAGLASLDSRSNQLKLFGEVRVALVKVQDLFVRHLGLDLVFNVGVDRVICCGVFIHLCGVRVIVGVVKVFDAIYLLG